MNGLQIFEENGFSIRTKQDGNQVWFVAADVCNCLDIANSRDALTRIPEYAKGVANTDTLGGAQEMAIVNEPGLYQLIFTSRKEEAVRFQRWVYEKVLPSIRKTGAYVINDKYQEPIPRKIDEEDRDLLSALSKKAKTESDIRNLIECCNSILREIKASKIAIKNFKRELNAYIAKRKVPIEDSTPRTGKRAWD